MNKHNTSVLCFFFEKNYKNSSNYLHSTTKVPVDFPEVSPFETTNS